MVGRAIWAVSALLLLASPSGAQQGKFENLRFEEDWSFLADPEAETTHLFPAIKYVELGDGWFASFGGQERLRWHKEDNRSLTGVSPRINDFWLHRARVHADLRHEGGMRFFLEMIDARIHGEERPPLGIDRNPFDVQNAFAEYKTGDTTMRAGRMELQYGAQRFVSPLDWGNTRRRFEGVLLRQDFLDASADLFVTKYVPVDPHRLDHDDDSQWFSGLYGTFDVGEGQDLDAFVLAHNESSSKVTGSDRKGGFDIYTVGLRHSLKEGSFDWEGEAAHQFGGYAGDTVRANALAARGGFTASELAGKPRFGLDLDWASGDSDPTDSTRETFSQLFPLGHAYLGYLDLVGRQNIFDVQPNVTVDLAARTKFRVGYHFFTLDDRHDGLYNAGGGRTFFDPSGSAGRDVGRELDLTLTHQPEALGPHGHVLVGYSTFSPGDYVDTLGSREHAHLMYTQLTFTF